MDPLTAAGLWALTLVDVGALVEAAGPRLVIPAAVAGLCMALVGGIITYRCERSGSARQPSWLCGLGMVLLLLGAAVLGFVGVYAAVGGAVGRVA
jgi:hypothetical protein